MTSAAAFAELCPGCFTAKGKSGICAHCGYDESLRRGPLVLPHRALLHHGQYLIGKVLGKLGGFGITYLALDTNLQTKVAIKEYLPRDLAGRDAGHATVSAHSAEDGELFRYGLTQFLQEARTLAQFDHANIVRVRNFFEENGTGYLVMDYYDGITLADYLAQQPQGRLPEKTAVGILMPILDGLREVHAKSFLHRDIKPQNIYLTTGNRAILLDFGAARQAMSERSRSLSVVLSEGYAPYEQYHRRGEQGPWTDIYACAAVLYHAVAGQAPPPATERMHKDELDIAAFGVSASLAEALQLGLAADHHNRPQRMTEFQALLLRGGDPILTDVTSPPPEASLRPSEKIAAPELTPASIRPPQNESDSVLMKWAIGLSILVTLVVGVVITMMVVGAGEQEKAAPSPDAAIPAAVPPAPTITAAPMAVRDETEKSLWNEAKAGGERKRLDAYLKQYPKGKYADLAEIELKKLDERDPAERNRLETEKKQAAGQLKAEQFRAEQQAWDQAKADNTPDAYAQYLKNHPKGRYVAMATAAWQKLQNVAAQNSDEQITASDELSALRSSVQAGLGSGIVPEKEIADAPATLFSFSSSVDAENWLTETAKRLEPKIPELRTRLGFLQTVHYEASRAGLDPQIVLALIDVQSGFDKLKVDKSGASGYMQVAPHWVKTLGRPGDNLLYLRTNLRYGTTILGYYLNITSGNLSQALIAYKTQKYPWDGQGDAESKQFERNVLSTWDKWWRYP